MRNIFPNAKEEHGKYWKIKVVNKREIKQNSVRVRSADFSCTNFFTELRNTTLQRWWQKHTCLGRVRMSSIKRPATGEKPPRNAIMKTLFYNNATTVHKKDNTKQRRYLSSSGRHDSLQRAASLPLCVSWPLEPQTQHAANRNANSVRKESGMRRADTDYTQ